MKLGKKNPNKWIGTVVIFIGIIIILLNVPSWLWFLMMGIVILGVGLELYHH